MTAPKKSMQQQLQSRISLRRNMVREMEADIFLAKSIAQRQMRIALNTGKEDEMAVAKAMYRAIRQGKDELNFVRLDQKLDKQLYAVLIEVKRSNEWFDDHVLTVREVIN